MIIDNVDNLMHLIAGTFDEMFGKRINEAGNLNKYNPTPEISDKHIVLNAVLLMSLDDISDHKALMRDKISHTLLKYGGRELFNLITRRKYLPQYIMQVLDFLFDQHILKHNSSWHQNQNMDKSRLNWDVKIIKLNQASINVHYSIVELPQQWIKK
jgi:hypothetical protein